MVYWNSGMSTFGRWHLEKWFASKIFKISFPCSNLFWNDLKVGSVHVRVRRDADEQMVLAHVYHRLSNLISVLNVQIFKDDWMRSNYTLHSDLMKPEKTPWLNPNPSSSQIGIGSSQTTTPLYVPHSTSSTNWQFSSPVLPTVQNLSDFQVNIGNAEQKYSRETLSQNNWIKYRLFEWSSHLTAFP